MKSQPADNHVSFQDPIARSFESAWDPLHGEVSHVPANEVAPRQSILLFEGSDADAWMFLRGVDESKGHRVVRALNTRAALEFIRAWDPSIIVIGCAMRGKEGYQLLEDLREHSEFDDISIVILSDSESAQNIRLAFALGANRFFLKPMHCDDYIACADAIATRESNLAPSISHYEKFPQVAEADEACAGVRGRQRYRAAMGNSLQLRGKYPWHYQRHPA